MGDLINAVAVESQPVREAEPVLTLEQKIERVERVIADQLRSGRRLLLAFSGGKDSSVLAALTLNAVRDLVAGGELGGNDSDDPALLVVHSNTRVENPVMSQYGLDECLRIRKFARDNQLPVRVDVVQPNLSNDYLVNLIGGRTVATLPGMGSKCSDMMKVTPITSHKNRVFRQFGRESVVTLIGKRADESAHRAANMAERGENALDVATNEQGDKVLSPLADFTMNDVFGLIGQVRAGRTQTYSDFEALVEHYRDMNAGECMVTVHMTGQAANTGCGARSGCWICLRVQDDRSMENMLEDERFGHLQPLNDLRQYLAAQHWNPAKRNWLARTVDGEGNIQIAPNAYSPAFCRELLRLVLSVQADEMDRAARTGEAMRFELLDERQLAAIQFLWARYGYHDYAEAFRIWDEIVNQGVRYSIPTDSQVHTREAFNAATRGVTGKAVFADEQFGALASGFRDLEAATCEIEATVDKGGQRYAAFDSGDEFDVDIESAQMMVDFELSRILDNAHRGLRLPSAMAFELLRMGVVIPRKGSESTQDRMLRMANQIERLNIRDVLDDPKALMQRLSGATQHRDPGKTTGQMDLLAEPA